ncbi:MAG: hypothetical protein ACRET1_04105, partial [Burkholderiales bacterium]
MTRAGFDLPDEGQILLDGNDLAATPYIDPQLAANPAIFPTPDVLKRLEYMNDLDHRQRRTLSHIWIEIKVRWISPSGFVDHPGLTYTLNKFRTRQYPTPLDNRTTHYSHRQPGKMLLAACLTGAAACLALAAVTPNGAFLALAAFVLIAVAIAFSSLTIEIDETQL